MKKIAFLCGIFGVICTDYVVSMDSGLPVESRGRTTRPPDATRVQRDDDKRGHTQILKDINQFAPEFAAATARLGPYTIKRLVALYNEVAQLKSLPRMPRSHKRNKCGVIGWFAKTCPECLGLMPDPTAQVGQKEDEPTLDPWNDADLDVDWEDTATDLPDLSAI
ncbi:MAG: hypothetical protein LBF54_00855 [Holosporaceae bacterium]|jgi:hypothetical protein|nr:hypothetical protein [Holosporaceae bacterium]